MNTVEVIVGYARVELAGIYASKGVVPREALIEALEAASEFAEMRSGLLIEEAHKTEAQYVLEGMFNVHVGLDHSLVNNVGHVPWLDEKREEITWEFWLRYRQWLIEDEHRSPSIVDDSVDRVTDNVLGLLEDPLRPGRWSRRGLVAGQVQSGKTSNYVALINKALDAGYKLIVVLAGTHDNLRSQTQIRINSGVLGFDSEGNINGSQGKRVGVGLKGYTKPKINCPTSSAQKGDFNRHLAKGVGSLGGDPVILVIKKNVHILKNLFAWATGMHHIVSEDGRKIVTGVPLLMIDDEADYASIDTGSVIDKVTGTESDPSATNRLIRQFLTAFEKSAYVGYTATPFANIFINSNAEHEDLGKDLFPEHFIVTLPESSMYSGASRVFGLDEDESSGIDAVEALPTTREISDYSDWLFDGHKKDDVPSSEIPESLREAVCSFILASALKRYRRVPTKHNSMLVHVTRFIQVQLQVTKQISDFVNELRVELLYSKADDPDSGLWDSIRRLYEDDFRRVNETMSQFPDLDGQMGELADFDDLVRYIRDVVDEVQVKAINGESGEALLYEESPDGVTVIAIGGDKLSRGLTLDGLTTSYYLRASKMYDTLMQMGRWFGYRPGYLDLCRLYTTQQLVTWYSRITAASERLYREFELMAAVGKSPRDFGLRVQQHPDGLMVTASNKSRFAKSVRASFSGTITETILFRDDDASRKRNFEQLQRLVVSVEASPLAIKHEAREFYWRGVPTAVVLEFIENYDGHKGATRALPKAMAEYIRLASALDEPELTQWDVFIASKPSPREVVGLTESVSVGLIERNGTSSSAGGEHAFVIKRLVSSGDELLPLRDDPERSEQAIQVAQANWEQSTRQNKSENMPETATPVAERNVRDPQRGFMLIYPLERRSTDKYPLVGFALSFPWSANAQSVDYQVNDVYWDLEMARTLEGDEDGS